MKRFIHYIVFAAAALAATSCVEPLNTVIPVQSQDLTITFSCGVMTKADPVPTLGADNENLVKRIDYFIFPYGEDGKVAQDAEYACKGTITTTDADKYARTYTETISHDELAKIFPDGNTKAMVFAVANYVDFYGSNNSLSPNTTIPEDAKTWEALHNLEVGSTFFYDDHTEDFGLFWPHALDPNPENNPEDADDLFFVMAGEAEITLVAAANAAAGDAVVNGVVPLERLASKVTVNFTYDVVVEHKESGDITWVPQPSGEETRVYLSNGIEHTTLGGPLDRDMVADSKAKATKPYGLGTRDIFEYAYNFMNDVPTIDGKKTAHFYTYPISIEEGDDNQPYLKLVLPWYGYKYIGEGTAPTFDDPADFDPTDEDWQAYKQMEVYYKIVIPRGTVNEGNCIYEYSVEVNIVGSDKDVKIIGDQYQVKDWGTKDPVTSNVATGRYISLDIPKDEYDMYVDEIDIHFVSSGTVIPIVREIYQLNYSTPSGGRDYFMQNGAVTASNDLKTAKGLTNEDIEGWVTIPEGTSYLKINHAMDNNMLDEDGDKNSAFDMAPYVFVVTLHLEAAGDDTSFDRTITVTQYPSLYVTSRLSNGYVIINNYSNANSGNVNVYDSRGNGSNNYRMGNIGYQAGTLNGTGTNDNPNNYIITSSILKGKDYILGDPRSQTVNNLTNLNGLTNYRPTETTGTQNTVAPKFIVASSYGATGVYFNLQTAQKRCAAYQENGYPAGRWRVPTFAEIEFLVTLSENGFIPSLFRFGVGDTTGYWSANGKVIGDSKGNPVLNTSYNDIDTAVRCVYDAWYWGEEPYQEGATTWLGYHDN